MWGALLVGALFTAFQPVRLAIVTLVITRPQPVANLFAYWVGALFFGIPCILVPLFVLHATPKIEAFTEELSTSSGFRHVQIGIGIFALTMAAVTVLRASRPQKTLVGSRAGKSAIAVADEPDLSPAPEAKERTAGSGSPLNRFISHARQEWEKGALWIACLVGISTGGPSIDGVLLGTAIIVTSGASTSTQILAGISFVFGILAIVEVILVSSVVAPQKTRSSLELLHTFVHVHRRKILITSLTLVGIALLAQGISGL